MDFRQRIWDSGWTLEGVSRLVGCESAHFHRVISGRVACSIPLSKKIESATNGAIRAWELLGLAEGPAPALPADLPKSA